MSDTVVYQSTGRGPVLAQGGIFTELRDEEEITNALWAFNADRPGPDGEPMRDPIDPPQKLGEYTVTERPRPVWLSKARLDDMIAQSQRAVRGGAS